MMHIFEKTGIRDRFELAMYGLKRSASRPAIDAAAVEALASSRPEPRA